MFEIKPRPGRPRDVSEKTLHDRGARPPAGHTLSHQSDAMQSGRFEALGPDRRLQRLC